MELNKMEDLYDILEVDFGCNEDEINSQYRKKIKKFAIILSRNKNLSSNDKTEIKTLKIAKYVLTDDELRKKYDLLKILEDSDDSKHSFKGSSSDKVKYTELQSFDVPLRKDKRIDYDSLSSRQFVRYEHKNFDLSKDRQLRLAKLARKDK